MTPKTKVLLLLSAILVFSVFQNNIAKAGFGISPPSVVNKNLVPGSFYQQDIFLVQNNPTETLHATAKIDAGNINSWIRIENGNTFDIPKGTQQFPMKVSVSVPSDANLGHYDGTITLNTIPASASKDGVQVTLGAEIKISIDVTSIQVSDFSIQNFQIPDVAKASPIKLIIKIKNDGNIDNGPTKASLTFFDQYHSKQLGQQEENITEKAKSFQTKDISVDFTNNFDVGQYWADVKIYNGEDVVVNSKIIFSVLAQTVLADQQEGFVFPNFAQIPVWVFIAVAVAVIIIFVIIIVILVLRRNKKNGIKKIKIHNDTKNQD